MDAKESKNLSEPEGEVRQESAAVAEGKEKKEPSKAAKGVQKCLGWLFLYVATFFLILGGQLVGGLLVGVVTGISSGMGLGFADLDVWLSAEMYLMFIGIWIVALAVMALRKCSRPIRKMLWTKMSGNNWKGILIGIAVGGGSNALCVLIAWLHGDINLHFESFQLFPLLFLLVAVLIQSAAEELTCRAYMYYKLMRIYKGNFWLSMILNSLFFGLLHLGNEGVTVLSVINIILTGIMFTMMVYYMDSLWAAFTAHMAWNYTQNIIFGLPNSGMVVPFSIFKLDASTAMDSFAYNVGFGIEGTIMADIVLLLGCVVIFLWGRKHGKNGSSLAADFAA